MKFKIWLTFRKIDRGRDCDCSSHRLEWHKTWFCHRLTYSCKPGWHGSLLTRLAVTHTWWMKFTLSQRRGNRKRGLSLAFLFQIVCFRLDRFLPHKRVYAESGWILHVRALFGVSSQWKDVLAWRGFYGQEIERELLSIWSDHSHAIIYGAWR